MGRSTTVNIAGCDEIVLASGGRSGVGGGGGVPRRNPLGDLKIPARMSQTQVGLRRDLGVVKELASNVEREFFLFILIVFK